MAKRKCDKCQKEKDMEGGKICERGHFFCRGCQYEFTKCPVDRTKLS
jgi:hypothetical protein